MPEKCEECGKFTKDDAPGTLCPTCLDSYVKSDPGPFATIALALQARAAKPDK